MFVGIISKYILNDASFLIFLVPVFLNFELVIVLHVNVPIAVCKHCLSVVGSFHQQTVRCDFRR
jgi:hypothetical protein